MFAEGDTLRRNIHHRLAVAHGTVRGVSAAKEASFQAAAPLPTLAQQHPALHYLRYNNTAE